MYDRVVIVDWSAASRRHAKPRADAIWLGIHEAGAAWEEYLPSRQEAEARLLALAEGRVLIGCDFPFGAPQGLAQRLTGAESAPALWHYLEARIQDGRDMANNRFAVAAGMNRALGAPVFWGCPAGVAGPDMPARKLARPETIGLPERRACERRLSGTQPFWKLYTTGSVGSQALMGMPMLARLARAGLSVWPWSTGRVTLAEVWPSLLPLPPGPEFRDQRQVRALAAAFFARPPRLTAPDCGAEGWILGPEGAV